MICLKFCLNTYYGRSSWGLWESPDSHFSRREKTRSNHRSIFPFVPALLSLSSSITWEETNRILNRKVLNTKHDESYPAEAAHTSSLSWDTELMRSWCHVSFLMCSRSLVYSWKVILNLLGEVVLIFKAFSNKLALSHSFRQGPDISAWRCCQDDSWVAGLASKDFDLKGYSGSFDIGP